MGSRKHFSISYTHESNGILEREHREVYRHMLCILKQLRKDKQWSMYTPLVQRILNSTIDIKLGISPAQLLYGNMVQPDRGIIHPFKVKCSSTSIDYIVVGKRLLVPPKPILSKADENPSYRGQNPDK